MQIRARGFTLIELLVVISIIGFLSTVVIASLNSARIKARDARRLEDMHNIRVALELYRTQYGTYPPTKSASACGGTDNWAESIGTCGGQWLTSDANFYTIMANVPVDPVNSAPDGTARSSNPGNYVYTYNGWDNDYDLIAQLETPNDPRTCGRQNAIYHAGNQPWCAPWTNNIGRSQQIIADH